MQKLINLFHWLFTDRSHTQYPVDELILFSALCLISIGIIMVYSASIAYAVHVSPSHNEYFYILRHVGYLSIGLVAGCLAFIVPTRLWQKYAPYIGGIIVLLLLLVLIPHVGKMVNGSRRWIGIGVLNLQPSEVAKLGMIIFCSFYISTRKDGLKDFMRDVMPILGMICLVALLLLLEPDMGSATVVFLIAIGILFVANINKIIIGGFSLLGIFSFVLLVLIAPYRIRRFMGFFNPWDDALGKGYQLTHSLLAVGHGSWFGFGLGNSIEKIFYLPEAHTDFIMSIIAEETGVAGVLVILLLFWIIFYRGFSIIGPTSKLLNRNFQGLVAQGISLWFLVQTLINIGVTIGLLPTKGLTLPFISFGGSSILVSCIALAILLKIDYENNRIKNGMSIE